MALLCCLVTATTVYSLSNVTAFISTSDIDTEGLSFYDLYETHYMYLAAAFLYMFVQ